LGTRPRLAIAYDITSSSPIDLAAKINGMCEIVWVVDASDSSLGSMSRLLPRLGTVVDTDGRPPDAVAELLANEPLDGVIAFTDRQLTVASAIGRSLDLAHNPSEVVDRLNDKFVQRTALASAGIPVPGFRRLGGGIDSQTLTDLVGDLSFPVVLKPVRGDSSRETRDIKDLPALIRLFEEKFSSGQSAGEDFIAEEYLGDRIPRDLQELADYVSVESIVQDGRPVPLAITGKFPLVEPFRESGNFMPHTLEADEASDVLALSTDSALALGVWCGALHTEIKFTGDGPRVIEVNGRIGGGGIDSIYMRTHGHSLTELAAEAALGRTVDLVPEVPTRQSGPFSYEFFVQPPMGARRLRSIAGSERLPGVAGARTVELNRSPGDALDWQQGSQGYVVQVGGVAQDRGSLVSVPDAVLELLEMSFD
jgi:carbamoylphosphate synthase large subunit